MFCTGEERSYVQRIQVRWEIIEPGGMCGYGFAERGKLGKQRWESCIPDRTWFSLL